MTGRTKWTALYLLLFCLQSLIAYYITGMTGLEFSDSSEYRLFLALLFSSITILPFFILTWIGFSKPTHKKLQAIGSGFLIWILLTDINVVLGLSGLQHAPLLVYLFDVLVGLFLVWLFRLPYGFAILSFIFSWLAVLYFLIYGQIRNNQTTRGRGQGA